MDKVGSDEENDFEKMVSSNLFQIDQEQVDFDKINYFNRKIKNVEIKYKGRKHLELESIIDQVTAEILDDDWESEGGTIFKEKTIKKLKDLVIEIMEYFSEQRIEFFPPKILPLLDGSLDIKWENNLFRLIINIPSDISLPIEIYGNLKYSELQENLELDCRIPYTIVKVSIIEWLKLILRYGKQNQ